MASDGSDSIAIRVTGSQPVPPALGANFFHFTTIGAEVHMLIGTVNLLKVVEAKERDRAESRALAPDITHRFLLSPVGFAQLKKQIDQIAPAVMGQQVIGDPEESD